MTSCPQATTLSKNDGYPIEALVEGTKFDATVQYDLRLILSDAISAGDSFLKSATYKHRGAGAWERFAQNNVMLTLSAVMSAGNNVFESAVYRIEAHVQDRLCAV